MPLSGTLSTALSEKEMIGWKRSRNRSMKKSASGELVDIHEFNGIHEPELPTLIGAQKSILSKSQSTNVSRTYQSPTTTVRPSHGQIPRPSVSRDDDRMVLDGLVDGLRNKDIK